MDNGWDVPPEEDIDTLLEDEDELEYIREIELQNKQNEILDVEKLLENRYQVIIILAIIFIIIRTKILYLITSFIKFIVIGLVRKYKSF